MMSNVIDMLPYIERQKALSRYEFQGGPAVRFISLICRMSIQFLTNKIKQATDVIDFINRALDSIKNFIFSDKMFVKSFKLKYYVNNFTKEKPHNSSLEKSRKS